MAPYLTPALAAGVHLAALDEDIIVLDTRSDAYGCLPDASRAVTVLGGRIRASVEFSAGLEQAGLLAAEETARALHPPPPLRTLPTISPSLADVVAVARAALITRRALKNRTLGELLNDARPTQTVPIDAARIASLTGAFVKVLPWLPDQGACLYRAYLLRRALRLAGQDALWVFGVRTWPFAAHCWLQVGDAVLDDDPARVALYTPILTT